MVAAYLQSQLKNNAIVRSRGVKTYGTGDRPYGAEARKIIANLSPKPDGNGPTRITKEDIEWADVILAADTKTINRVLGEGTPKGINKNVGKDKVQVNVTCDTCFEDEAPEQAWKCNADSCKQTWQRKVRLFDQH